MTVCVIDSSALIALEFGESTAASLAARLAKQARLDQSADGSLAIVLRVEASVSQDVQPP